MSAPFNRVAILRLLLAHHPACGLFQADVYRLGPLRLCVGCFTAYPTALAAFLGLLVLGLPAIPVLFVGLVVGSAEFFAVAGWTRTRRRKIATKLLLGFGLAATVYGVWAAPWSLAAKAVFLLVGVTLASLAQIPKVRRLLATCDRCMHHRDWDHCLGIGLRRTEPPVAPLA